jgi:DNA polymerase-3 subunit beta
MRVTLPRPVLADAIARGAAVAAKNSPLAILNYTRLRADMFGFAVATCDHDRFAEANCEADVAEVGSACVDTQAFKTLIGKHGKNAAITLELVDDLLIVSSNRSRVKLPILEADKFPAWADADPLSEFILPNDDFVRAFERVRSAASTLETQWYLQGVCLDYHDSRLHFAATDTHRIAVSGMIAPDGSETCPRIIVPSEAVEAALTVFKGGGDIKIAVSEKAISFSSGAVRLSAKLVDGTFPPYEKIIPDRGSPSITIKRADFVDCLSRANCFVGQAEYSSITARPDGDTLQLDAKAPGKGEAHEELSATIDDGFQPFGFNPRYAEQFLATLNVGQLTIEQSDPTQPHLIWSEDAPDFVGVLAPVRIKT